MSVIRIDDFAGLNLRQDPKKGPYAQVAENVDLDTNALVPTWGLDLTSKILLGNMTEKKTIYNLYGTTFVSWTQDVHIAASPLADDSDKRIYYSGDGEPRVTDYSRIAAGAAPYVLGIPAMHAISIALSTAAGGAGTAQSRAYVYTYVTPWGEEGPPSAPLPITANETGATVHLRRIGVSPRVASSSGLPPNVMTFVGVPTPGYMQFDFGVVSNLLGLREGDRVALTDNVAGAPAAAEGSYVVSYVNGSTIRFAANCWPFAGGANPNPQIVRILPMNRFPIGDAAVGGSYSTSSDLTTITFKGPDLAGLRVGEQVYASGTGVPALDNVVLTVKSIAGQDDNRQTPAVTCSWSGGVAGGTGAATLNRVAHHNTGEVRITGIAFAAGVATLTLDHNAELIAGDRVLIVGVMGAYQINGVREIASLVGPNQVTIAIAALGAYTSGGLLVRPIPYSFDEYKISAIAAAAGGPYPAPFTVDITLDRNYEGRVGDFVIGYDIDGAVELNTVLAVSALPAANQIRVSMASGHAAWGGVGGSIAVVERQAKRRLYRTIQGTTDAEYQLVEEFGADRVYYKDTANDANLSGTVLESSDWIAPPTDLINIVAHPHSFLMGITEGNIIAKSEAAAPHAWPIRLQTPIPARQALAMAVVGSTAVITTNEKPFVLTGSDPASMLREALTTGEPCTAARSMVGGRGVIYRGTTGFNRVDGSGAESITREILKPDYFATTPRTIAAWWRNKYVWIDNTSATGYVFDPTGADHALTTFRLDYAVSALHVSPVDGLLWAAYVDTSTAPSSMYAAPLFKIVGSTVRFDYQSRYFYLPKPVTLAWLCVDFDWASTSSWMQDREKALIANMRVRRTGSLGTVSFGQSEFGAGLRRHVYQPSTTSIVPSENYLKVTVTANPDSVTDRAVVFDDFVANDTPVKVDDGVKSDVWQVRLLGTVRVTALTLASSMEELRQV